MEVEVIVTAYNNPSYLVECLRSLKNQSWQHFKAIIVDDCGAEPTLVHAYKEVGDDPRFTLVQNEQNLGGALTFMSYANKTDAKYVMWLHHDDWIDPSFLEKTYNSLQLNESCSFAYCLISRVIDGVSQDGFPSAIRPDLQTGVWDVSYDSVINCWIMWSSALIRVDSYKNMGGLDSLFDYQPCKQGNLPVRRGESDLYAFAKLSSIGKVYVINERLCFYRSHDEANTVKQKNVHIQQNLNTYDLIFQQSEFFSDEIRVVAKINSIARLATELPMSDVAYRLLYVSKVSRECTGFRRQVLERLAIVMDRFIRDDFEKCRPRVFLEHEITFLKRILDERLD